MKKLFYGFCCLILLLSSTTLYAKEGLNRNNLLSNTTTQQYGPIETQQQFSKNSTTVIANPQQRSSQVAVYRSTNVLPFFSDRLGLTEETNPLPFTIMLFGNYMQTTVLPSNFQGSALVEGLDIRVKDVLPGTPPWLGGNRPIFKGDMLMPLTGLAEVTAVKQRFVTGGIRFAVNILPFWSVYGIFANSTGTTETSVKVKEIRLKDISIPSQGAIVDGIIAGLGNTVLVNEGTVPFTMAFDATSVGAGTTLSIGGKVFFASLDTNYVITAVESANILVHTITASTRVGMYKRSRNGSFISMWVGGNYMENIAGSDKLGAVFSVEKLGDLFPLAGLADKLVGSAPASLRWAVDQKPISVFSMILGMKYSPTANFDIVAEVNMIDRLTTMVSVGYNF